MLHFPTHKHPSILPLDFHCQLRTSNTQLMTVLMLKECSVIRFPDEELWYLKYTLCRGDWNFRQSVIGNL